MPVSLDEQLERSQQGIALVIFRFYWPIAVKNTLKDAQKQGISSYLLYYINTVDKYKF
ncbi:hypothetical protein DSCW_51970 [Desulfosarcina widdelii]|uniref:Uncharacterized protein n=1 Tax=Desulfosarcina widdelii TaxID=947919 RepID=A0A5K7ZAH3_9BACT|nr:hypothetical protein DSCW_51970 [Desulfosarcina widdelii]